MTGPTILIGLEPSPSSRIDEIILGSLRTDLLTTDALSVEPSFMVAPDGSMGAGALAGWLAVQLGALGGVRVVIDLARAWASRSQRTVKLVIDGDVLEISHPTSDQQDRLIAGFLARHDGDT